MHVECSLYTTLLIMEKVTSQEEMGSGQGRYLVTHSSPPQSTRGVRGRWPWLLLAVDACRFHTAEAVGFR